VLLKLVATAVEVIIDQRPKDFFHIVVVGVLLKPVATVVVVVVDQRTNYSYEL